MLEREEHIEQAYLFKALVERGQQNVATQDLLLGLKEEVLSTSKLALAIDFLIGELKREAEYRATGATRQGVFLYEFESLSRNRLGYDYGLEAVAADPIFDNDWREWIAIVRRQVGFVDVADLIYVRSEYYLKVQRQQGHEGEPEVAVLFGEKEGRIALANRRKDPLFLFAALNRQLGYPQVPRQKPADESVQVLPTLLRRVERLETRIKLLEEEQKGGIDLSKFYRKEALPPE
jgi:hypothetical protein